MCSLIQGIINYFKVKVLSNQIVISPKLIKLLHTSANGLTNIVFSSDFVLEVSGMLWRKYCKVQIILGPSLLSRSINSI